MAKPMLLAAVAALALGLGSVGWGPGNAAAQTMAKDTAGTPQQRAAAMLAQMSEAEKLTLVKGYFGTDFLPAKFTAPEEARAGSAGYVPGIARLGMPPQWQADAGIGVATQGGALSKRGRTALPSGLGVAASWDPAIAYEGGRMIGAEARADGFNVMLAGSVNLMREPRNGRNFEYAGEDPLLAGTMAGAAIAGIQSNRMISTLKHYAVNDQETDRGAYNVLLGEAEMRMSDLLAFQIALEKGDPGSVMCAYNRVNGPYACESRFLLTDVLRRDWGFAGYVMTDWGAAHSTAAAANAGLDQESGYGLQKDDHFGEKLAQALANGEVSKARLDEMAGRILSAMFAHGLIDDPASEGHAIDFAANQAVSRRAAETGAVLLRNEGRLLPLGSGAGRIAVIGGHADKGVLSGGGSSQVYPLDGPGGGNAVPGLEPKSWPGPVVYYPSSPLEELRKQLPDARFDFVDGSDPAAAAAAAAQADVAIVFGTQWASESIDVAMKLDGDQDALIAAVAAANPKAIVVLQTGGPVKMPWADDVGAILEAWYPGRAGGEAIANLLTGKVNPSGRLPASFPASEAQLPYPGEPRKGEVAYTEGAAVGYKWLDKTGQEPLFPFGFGLSYTHFTIDAQRLIPGEDGAMGLVSEVTFTNSGERKGAGVVQLYASHPGWEAPQRLVGFAKVELEPGDHAVAKIAIDPRLLAVWDADLRGWVVESGDYQIHAGFSSRDSAGYNTLTQEKMLFLPAGWKPKK